MTTEMYLEKLIANYKSTFDITGKCLLGDINFSAYGYFCSHSEKYVLTKSAQLWEANCYEYIFFLEKDSVTMEDIQAMDEMLHTFAEPVLVLKGGKLPARNHMYSYLTYVLICKEALNIDVKKALKTYRFHKNYLLSIRGWCDARVLVIDTEKKEVACNRKAAPLKKLYQSLLAE